jgi:ribosome-binding factor A
MMGRLEKVNQQLKREISYILQKEFSDQRMVFVSVTAVDVSPDLCHARVFFSYLGELEQVESIQQALCRASGMIRRLVARQMQMRKTPDFTFIYDDSISAGSKLAATLEDIRNEGDVEKTESA